MVIGDTAKKLQKMMDTVEELYKRLNEMRDQFTELRNELEESNARVQRIEREVVEQRALIEAIAEEKGIDVDEALKDVELQSKDAPDEGGEEKTESTPASE